MDGGRLMNTYQGCTAASLNARAVTLCCYFVRVSYDMYPDLVALSGEVFVWTHPARRCLFYLSLWVILSSVPRIELMCLS